MIFLIDSYSETNYTGAQFIYYNNSSPGASIGQTFTNTVSDVLVSCKFFLNKVGLPTGNLTATLHLITGTYGVNSKAIGVALATSDNVDIAGLDTEMALINFIFTGQNQIVLNPLTYYAIQVNYSVGDVSNCLAVGVDTTTPTASGNWYSVFGSNLIGTIFYVYGNTISPLPSHLQ